MTTPHQLTWVTAAPLWDGLVTEHAGFRSPAVLRFCDDDFMDRLLDTLETQPAELSSFVATQEEGDDELKLYQPIHGRYHLVAASLVCQRPGLPDHRTNRSRGESASFVLRRLHGAGEQAWIPARDPTLPGEWRSLSDPEVLATGEDLLPLFPGMFMEAERKRELYFGLIPTTSSETFALGENLVLPKLVPKLDDDGVAEQRYVIRCVFRRPRCEYKTPPLLSEPSAPFVIASYFDPDAPARDVRIATPPKLTSAVFEKMKKGVSLVLSSQLNTKLSQIPLANGDNWSFDKDELKNEEAVGGKICSFSIPIVTLVAMILLMVIVSLLNLVFQWISLVRKCVPIGGGS